MGNHNTSKDLSGSVVLTGIALVSCVGGVSLIGTAKAAALEEPAPFGINNPFDIEDTDPGSPTCLSNARDTQTISRASYKELHRSLASIKTCAPTAVKYMDAIGTVGVNVISQHFKRNYMNSTSDAKPYFNDHEIPVQLYINGYGHYFWAAINPASIKGFLGDIQVDTGYLPNSDLGFAEWRKWLSAMFDYLDDHQAMDHLLYIQLGNESDGDYAKRQGANAALPEDYHWLAYARLIQESGAIIKARAPHAKILIGAMGAGSVAVDGFYRPVLKYLAGRIDEAGMPISQNRLCGGSGCFDAFDYHDFSEHTEVNGRIVAKSDATIVKNPATFRKLLDETGFHDKNLTVQQGGTYTGYDEVNGKVKQPYQTEKDQAAFLVNRAIALITQGVEESLFATYIEHYGYNNTIHSWFTLMGLVFNETPRKGELPPYQKDNPLPADYVKRTCDGQLPCSDPGEGVKKLAWFSQKKLIEMLKGSDWTNAKALDTGVPDTFAYAFAQKNNAANPVYALTWYWWKTCPIAETIVEQYGDSKFDHALMDSLVGESNKDCVSAYRPTVNLSVGLNASEVKISEAIPDLTTGQEADIVGYDKAFKSSIMKVSNGIAAIPLGKKPLYVAVASVMAVDTSSPAIPSGLDAVAVSSTQINLSWNASSDNVGVAGYKVSRNSVEIATTSALAYADARLLPSTDYAFTVSAYDGAGNTSAQSASISTRTGAFPAPVITSALDATGTAGTSLSYQITATNSPTSFNAAGLPAGLSISAATGLIAGTPAAAGTSSVTISASNGGGTGANTLTLSVYSACDLNRDEAINVSDVQLQINQALGAAACASDLNRDGSCNVIDVQRCVNAALGGPCLFGP